MKEKFTLAAFDNFDSSGRSSPTGTMSNHDTVSVLFQIKPDELPSKPLMFTVAMKKGKSEGFKQYLCQNLRTYNRQSKILLLPPTFVADESFFTLNEKETNIEKKEFALNFIRSMVPSNDESIPTWAGCHTLVSTSEVPIMQVGFLPYLSHPVTDHPSVYTAMCNFLSVLGQLKQKSLR